MAATSQAAQPVKLRLHFGGVFRRKFGDDNGEWTYVGGNVHNDAIPVGYAYADVAQRMNLKFGDTVSFRYMAPGEALDPNDLVAVTDDDDLKELYDEYFGALSRPNTPLKTFRVKVYVFPALQTGYEVFPALADDGEECDLGEEQAGAYHDGESEAYSYSSHPSVQPSTDTESLATGAALHLPHIHPSPALLQQATLAYHAAAEMAAQGFQHLHLNIEEEGGLFPEHEKWEEEEAEEGFPYACEEEYQFPYGEEYTYTPAEGAVYEGADEGGAEATPLPNAREWVFLEQRGLNNLTHSVHSCPFSKGGTSSPSENPLPPQNSLRYAAPGPQSYTQVMQLRPQQPSPRCKHGFTADDFRLTDPYSEVEEGDGAGGWVTAPGKSRTVLQCIEEQVQLPLSPLLRATQKADRDRCNQDRHVEGQEEARISGYALDSEAAQRPGSASSKLLHGGDEDLGQNNQAGRRASINDEDTYHENDLGYSLYKRPLIRGQELASGLPSHISAFGDRSGGGSARGSPSQTLCRPGAAQSMHQLRGGRVTDGVLGDSMGDPRAASVQLPSHISAFGECKDLDTEDAKMALEAGRDHEQQQQYEFGGGKVTEGPHGRRPGDHSQVITQEFALNTNSFTGRNGDGNLGFLDVNFPPGNGVTDEMLRQEGPGGGRNGGGSSMSTPKLLLESVPHVPRTMVNITHKIGEGAFGEVSRAEVFPYGTVAIKWLKRDRFAKYSESFQREAEVLARLNHPNIIRMFGLVSEPNDPPPVLRSGGSSVSSRTGGGAGEEMGPAQHPLRHHPNGSSGSSMAVSEHIAGIMMEFVRGGSLAQRFRTAASTSRRFSLRERCRIARQAALGMSYLHDQQPAVIHFDLKPDNLLVEGEGEDLLVKVADFGLSKHKFQNYVTCHDLRGTLPYMAPELVANPNKVCEKCDVWSMGVVMWEMFTLEVPFQELTAQQILVGLMQGSLQLNMPEDCEAEWRDLVEVCMNPNPGGRPTFKELASHLDHLARGLAASTGPPTPPPAPTLLQQDSLRPPQRLGQQGGHQQQVQHRQMQQGHQPEQQQQQHRQMQQGQLTEQQQQQLLQQQQGEVHRAFIARQQRKQEETSSVLAHVHNYEKLLAAAAAPHHHHHQQHILQQQHSKPAPLQLQQRQSQPQAVGDVLCLDPFLQLQLAGLEAVGLAATHPAHSSQRLSPLLQQQQQESQAQYAAYDYGGQQLAIHPPNQGIGGLQYHKLRDEQQQRQQQLNAQLLLFQQQQHFQQQQQQQHLAEALQCVPRMNVINCLTPAQQQQQGLLMQHGILMAGEMEGILEPHQFPAQQNLRHLLHVDCSPLNTVPQFR